MFTTTDGGTQFAPRTAVPETRVAGGAAEPGAIAFLDVLLLWLAVAVTMNLFRRVRPMAGTLLIPYLAWVTFAAALTYAVWKANPGVL